MKLIFYSLSHILLVEIKAAWKDMSDGLSSLLIPGKFLIVPHDISIKFNELVSNLIQSLSIEWDNSFNWFKRCVTHQFKALLSANIYVLG